MSATTVATFKIKQMIDNAISAVRLTLVYLKRKNPFLTAYANIYTSVRDLLTINTKLKIAQYRVNHMRYRLNQMESLIDENQSSSMYNGSSIDTFR